MQVVFLEMSNSSHLTTKEVARLFNVSDATVKRWEDAGMLRSERTGGGHRRFRAEEVVRFQRSQGIGVTKSKTDDAILRSVTRQRESKTSTDSPLLNALLEGNEEQASNLIIREYLKETSVTDIFDKMVGPTMTLVGDLWYQGDIAVTQEHLATRTLYAVIHKLRNMIPFPEPNGKLALCCSAEGDLHELPTHLAQIILENFGWEVINFGANTPLYCLSDEVFQYRPNLICITAKTIPDVERFSREYKNFREQTRKMNIPVVLGGRIFKETRFVNRFEAELFADSFTEFERFVLKLNEKK